MSELYTKEVNPDSQKRMNGIRKYLKAKGYSAAKYSKIVDAFVKTIETSEPQDTFRRKCKIVQAHFGQFVRWLQKI